MSKPKADRAPIVISKTESAQLDDLVSSYGINEAARRLGISRHSLGTIKLGRARAGTMALAKQRLAAISVT